jgi:hypothetical protein
LGQATWSITSKIFGIFSNIPTKVGGKQPASESKAQKSLHSLKLQQLKTIYQDLYQSDSIILLTTISQHGHHRGRKHMGKQLHHHQALQQMEANLQKYSF